jgi:carbonic anhydrase
MTDPVLERLKDGIRHFRTDVYPKRAEQYETAMREPQAPHALVITCADSRIHPDTLTQSQPGELFVTRNIGNMVPAYGDMLGGVSAVLEFAVSGLKVRHIVVCGHSDCGAMKALVDPASVAEMPTVRHWLHNAHAALSVAQAKRAPGQTEAEFLQSLAQKNVLLQMQHVRTHPSVAGAIARGELTISGWYYDIAKGRVLICEGEDEPFEAVTVAGEEDVAVAAISTLA